MKKILTISISLLLLIFGMSYAIADAPVKPKKWTFLIYLNGKNNLDEFGTENIKAMETVGSNDEVNVIVEWASGDTHVTKRLYIQKSTDPSKVTSPVLQTLGNDMGDYRSLEDFIAWGVQNYPADHYFVDVWDHGSGWHSGPTNTKNLVHGMHPHLMDISWDDDTGHFISTEQMGQVMAYMAKLIGHKVDIYGSDACLMAMPEVANEMSDSAQYFLGSEQMEPGAGWPYDDILSRWYQTKNATADQISRIVVDAYVNYYKKTRGGQVTFSAYDLSKMDEFNQAMKNLGGYLQTLNPNARAQMVTIVNNTLNFDPMGNDYLDLKDFLTNLSTSNLTIDKNIIAATQKALNDFVILNEDTTYYQKAGGVTIWYPRTESFYNMFSTRYHGLKFDQATGWGNTLGYLLQGVH